jgi:tetratricopeptide (TPR) repeat protein
MLGRMLTDVGELTQGLEATQKAYDLRDHASEHERYFITASYHLLVTGDLAKAEETCQLWIQAYPRAVEPRNLIAGPVYLQMGRYEQTIAQANEAIRAHPTLPIAYAHVVFADIALNRIDAATHAYEDAVGHHIDSSFTDFGLYFLEFLKGDAAGRAKVAAAAVAKPGMEEAMRANEALTAGYFGRVREARDLMQQSADSAGRAGRKEERAGYLAAAALTDSLTGNAPAAEREAAAVLDLSTARDNQYAAALALAMAGTPGRARRIAEELARRLPQDTVAQLNYLPTLQAQLALVRGDGAGAIELLRPATSYELGQPGQTFVIFLAGLPIYVRGEAYLAAHQGRAAAAEFQKILDHEGVVLNEPIGSLAHLGVARALSMQHEDDQARAAYDAFFRIWKEADADLPLLRQAKAEYATVR